MTENQVLRRLLKADGAEKKEKPGRMTPGRVLRTSMARAADTSVGLSLTVLGVADETANLEEAVSRAGEDSLFYAVTRFAETVGYAALDGETRSALVEVQTVGRLRETRDDARLFTAGDVELCRPLIDAFLREIRCLADDTPLEGWTNGASSGPRISGARSVGLALSERHYRVVRLTLDFGVAEREGTIVLCLPNSRGPSVSTPHPPPPSETFGRELRANVMDAPARLHAVLHRAQMSLSEVEGFQVGQVLPLTGITVASVRLEGPRQRLLAHARLGQVSGLRAVRLEQARDTDMAEVPIADAGRPAVAPPDPADRVPRTAAKADAPAETGAWDAEG